MIQVFAGFFAKQNFK